jgi:predicted acylesterase/phospholipase RssA
MIRHLLWPLILITITGCNSLPLWTSANEPLLVDKSPASIVARDVREVEDVRSGLFVGIAMSGGGSRAANYAAAIMLELQKLGLTEKHITAVAGVSGGSIPATLFALNGHNSAIWNESHIRKLLITDFEKPWMTRIFAYPHNWLRLSLTHYDRSDVMKGVFDDYLFHNKTFGDIPLSAPKLYITASVSSPRFKESWDFTVGFRFTEESFRALGSRLDTYPLSHAVMASGAFPGVFHNVTLTEFCALNGCPNRSPFGKAQQSLTRLNRYLHLYDGGPNDNLGLEALVEAIRSSWYSYDLPIKGCLMISIDAYVSGSTGIGIYDGDTRSITDNFVDRNFIYATDRLLERSRNASLAQFGYPTWGSNRYRIRPFSFGNPYKRAPIYCEMVHVALDDLTMDFEHGYHNEEESFVVKRLIKSIETRYFLHGTEYRDVSSGYEASKQTFSPKEIQDAIFDHAKFQFLPSGKVRNAICSWFNQMQTSLPGCKNPFPNF